MNNLLSKIKNKKINILLIGLGYVGFPLLKLFEKKNFNVTGLDLNKELILKLNRKTKANLFNDYENVEFSKIDIIILALPTPVTKNNNPDLTHITNCIKKIFNKVRENSLVILESTSYPGTTFNEIVKPFKKKFNLGKNFFVGYSPEREDPGNKKFSIANITKIVSGYTEQCMALTACLYSSVCKKIIKSSSMEAAEMAKIFENIFRAVNIALVNETNEISSKLNIDFHEVLNLCKTKPFGFMEFRPGPGVGGHCIPVDPFYLSWLAKRQGITSKFISLAGEINGKRPNLIAKKIKLLFMENKISLNDKIIILGMAYKKNVPDTRNSPAKDILEIMAKDFKNIEYYDPFVPQIKINKKLYKSKKKFNYKITKYKAAILLTDHSAFKKIKFNLKKILVIDCKNFFKNKKIIKL